MSSSPVIHRQPLAGIENERDAGFLEFARMLHHALASIGRDDAQTDVARVRDVVQVRVVHRTRMKRGDLVVIQIGRDEGLRRERVRDLAHMRSRQAQFLQPIGIRLPVVAHARHDQRIPAEHLQRVGDIARTAAEFAAHVGHQEGDVQDVNLLGQNVVLETIAKHHDGVVGNGTADQRAHGCTGNHRGA